MFSPCSAFSRRIAGSRLIPADPSPPVMLIKAPCAFNHGVAGSGRTRPRSKKYRVTYCARTSPLPLLPSGPGGVGGITSRRTRHQSILAPVGGWQFAGDETLVPGSKQIHQRFLA